MEYAEEKVRIFDAKGIPFGVKPRKEINKQKDVVHAVHVLLHNGKEFFVCRIPKNKQFPNMYENKLSTTAATMVRSGEEPVQSAERALAREIRPAPSGKPIFLHESFEAIGGVHRWLSLFSLEIDSSVSSKDVELNPKIQAMTRVDIENEIRLHPKDFAPSFLILWERAKQKFSVK